MSNALHETIEVVTKLIELTQRRQVVWEVYNGRALPVNDESRIIGTGFMGDFNQKRLLIYSLRCRVDSPNFRGGIISSAISRDRTYPYWENSISLDIVDAEGNRLWSFPYVDGMRDLLRSISHRVSGAEGLINELLSFPSEKNKIEP